MTAILAHGLQNRRMGTLYLVRHGQASFGAADYDQLSPLGLRQCQWLGEWMAERGLRFDAVFLGSLRRHHQSLEAMAQSLPALPAAIEWEGLNEYDSEALVRCVNNGVLPAPAPDGDTRGHFRLLRTALLRWMQGEIQPAGMPTWAAFSAGVRTALDMAAQHAQGQVLMVSSGGPISTAIGQVLGLQASAVVELNLRLRNSALSEVVMSGQRLALLSFNSLPHLEPAGRHLHATYA